MRERERGPGGGGSITTAGGATECHALRPHSTLLARHDTTKRGLVTLTAFSPGNHRARGQFRSKRRSDKGIQGEGLSLSNRAGTVYILIDN